MRRAPPTWAATAIRTGRPFSPATGCSSSASRASRYSGSMPALASSRRAASRPACERLRAGAALGGAQRAREGDGALAGVGVEVGVARAHRQPVGLAHRRQHLDPHREVEVAGHPPDNGRLLGVLLAEVGDVGADAVEELGDDGGDAAEVLGAAARGVAVEHLGQAAADLDRGGEAVGVDLLDRRRVDEVGPGLGGQAQVALLVARVALEVLAGAELGRVDEEAHHDHVALGAGGAQQREVALVQVAHRRHQADRAARRGGPGPGQREAPGRERTARAARRSQRGGCRCGSSRQQVHALSWVTAGGELYPFRTRLKRKIKTSQTNDPRGDGRRKERESKTSPDRKAVHPMSSRVEHRAGRLRRRHPRNRPRRDRGARRATPALSFLKKAGLAGGAVMGGGALLSALTPAASMAAGQGPPAGQIRQGRHRHPQLRPHPRVPGGRLLQRGDRQQQQEARSSRTSRRRSSSRPPPPTRTPTSPSSRRRSAAKRWPLRKSTSAAPPPSEASFIKTAVALENTGVHAYAGQATEHHQPRLHRGGGLSISTIEARHASVAGLLLKATPGNISPDGPFDTPNTAAEVLKAVEETGFLK